MMTQQEYAEYLFKLLGEEPQPPDQYDGWEDFFYGLFQSFMPGGEGVATVFEPLERGQELLARILPVYQSTSERNSAILESGYAPGYFCPPAQSETEAQKTGEKLLAGLQEFARFAEDEALLAALAAVKEIHFGEPDDEYNETAELLGEAFDEWRIGNTDHDSPAQVLAEAYYSVEYNKPSIYKAFGYISVPQSLRLKLIFIQYNQRLEIFCGTDSLPWPCLY
ncbi:hypothetical protein [Eikenella longinqua]|uniref:hypothetical protein n=1 Tax=Eikenella longinqua TaxID=1795827 RepID=UPI001FE090D7|nr:hypothetical protein [Eikenella longinqua]